jgi:hypothetical protein
MKNFITSKDIFPPILAHVFEDYNKLDALAEKRGYKAVETSVDDTFQLIGFVGLQNGHLHSGWIALMDDYDVKSDDQIKLLKQKIAECENRGEKVIVGFCRTGHFSVGYSIYRKRKVFCNFLKMDVESNFVR